MRFYSNKLALLIIFPALITLASCKNAVKKNEYPKNREARQEERIGKITGDGLVLMGGKKSKSGGADGINVNSCLWRASLDIAHSMPITSADPFGGTIFTDWYKIKPGSTEKYKINIFIIGAELRSDAIRVTVFKEKQDKNGNWNQVQPSKKMASQIENMILERAREIKTKSSS